MGGPEAIPILDVPDGDGLRKGSAQSYTLYRRKKGRATEQRRSTNNLGVFAG